MSFETQCKVPGLQPSSEEDGNLGDISKAGSFHEFLVDLHKKFGPVASFWWGKKYTVSIASAEVFEEITHVFDRPPETYQHFSAVMEPKCIQFANGQEGQKRREHYMKSLTDEEIKKTIPQLQQVTDQLVKQWIELRKTSNIPLTKQLSLFSLKAIIHSLLGNLMKDDSKEELDFRTEADDVWSEIEISLVKPTTKEREEHLQDCRKDLSELVKHLIDDRKANPPRSEAEMTFLDRILSYTDDTKVQHADAMQFSTAGQFTMEYDRILSYTDDTEVQHADVMEFSTAGQFLMEYVLLCATYHVATHPDVQQKLYDEIKAVLDDGNVDGANMDNLVYLRQVLDETLRCSFLVGWAARISEADLTLGGYKIPKNTPLIQALGVSLLDETVWSHPNDFDSERFSKTNQQKRSKLCFSPFGIGKRECLMKCFPYAAATVYMVAILRKFKVHLANKDQALSPVYGLVNHQNEEVYISLTER